MPRTTAASRGTSERRPVDFPVAVTRPPRAAYLLAARPRTLWAAVAPVLVGSALAVRDDGFRFDAFVAALVAALAVQVAVNFANDAADAARGADGAARIGPTRAVGSGLLTPRQMWAGVWAAFGVAGAAGLYLAWIAGWVVVVIGAASVAAALGYTSGPAYGYRGLGELFVFVFFGMLATVGTRFVHDRSAPAEAWLLAVPIGLLVTAILVANNVRDLDTDAAVGKRTLAVALGRRYARLLFAALITGAFALVGAYALAGLTPRGTAVALAAAPLAVSPVRAVASETAGEPLIAALEGTARLHLAFAVLLAAGALLGG